MITNITLENFKCFRQVSINPKRLTVLIGPNGTGKSSVLQALLLHKQTVEGGYNRPVYQGNSIDLRGRIELTPNFSQELPNLFVKCQVASTEDPDVAYLIAFRTLRNVPAVRGLVQWTYPLGDQYVEQLSLQQGFDAQEHQLASNLVYASSTKQKLSDMLMKVTGTGLNAETVPAREIEVKSVVASGSVNIVLEGFGANSLIQLLHQVIIAQQGATVLIEEPEIHLHPKAQAELAEVMAETAKAEDKQIIMTTHSEHLLSRLLTLVAERRLAPEELAIYSFEKDEKGECSATEIEVTELGQVTGGLTGFFDANLDEMDRYIKALQTKA